jgi:hypothetical protein
MIIIMHDHANQTTTLIRLLESLDCDTLRF